MGDTLTLIYFGGGCIAAEIAFFSSDPPNRFWPEDGGTPGINALIAFILWPLAVAGAMIATPFVLYFAWKNRQVPTSQREKQEGGE